MLLFYLSNAICKLVELNYRVPLSCNQFAITASIQRSSERTCLNGYVVRCGVFPWCTPRGSRNGVCCMRMQHIKAAAQIVQCRLLSSSRFILHSTILCGFQVHQRCWMRTVASGSYSMSIAYSLVSLERVPHDSRDGAPLKQTRLRNTHASWILERPTSD